MGREWLLKWVKVVALGVGRPAPDGQAGAGVPGEEEDSLVVAEVLAAAEAVAAGKSFQREFVPGGLLALLIYELSLAFFSQAWP